MLNVNFKGYGDYVTDRLYQWDKNRVLAITGLDLDVIPEIHFTNATMDKAIVRQSTVTDGVIKVNIPNSLLQDPFAVIAYIGIYEGSLFKTIETIKIPVVIRARPVDYAIEDTDEEIYSFATLENQIANRITYAEFNKHIDGVKRQIANIVANTNNTEGNSELVDIRNGADGTIYESAGEAVRTQIGAKANKEQINHFYALDIVSDQFSEFTNLYPSGDIIKNYTGGAWVYSVSDSFSLTPGLYTLFLPNVPVGTTATLEYVGGVNDVSLRITSPMTKPGLYIFDVTRDDLDIEIRLQVSTSTEKTPDTYGLYNIAIYEGNLSNIEFLPKKLIGVDEKLDKKPGKNLFDKNSKEIEYYKYLDQYGGIYESQNYYITGFISIKPNTSYALHDWTIGGAYVVFYSETKAVLMDSSIQGNYSPTSGVFITPENAYYIRLTGRISSINTNQLEEGSVKTSYEPYTEYLPVIEVEKRVDKIEEIIKRSDNIVKNTGVASLNNGEYLTLIGNLDVKKNKTLTFFANVTSFGSLLLGHGETSYGGAYIEIDDTSIIVYSYTTGATVVKTVAHGLTISGFVTVVIDVGTNADITVFTASGSFTVSGVSWSGCNGSIFAKSVGSVLTNCELKWTSSDLFSNVWVFGDSYLGLTNSARFPYHLLALGFEKWLACGYPGAGANSQRLSFENLLTMKIPKVVVWGMGMNNPDDGAINSSWLTETENFIALCEENNITPILATIPSCWGSTSDDSDITLTRDNSYKNTWVKESGYRYVDFEKAVGADSGTGWYEGMLSGDGVHPTELGAKALASRFIIDVPEIAQK